jgi:hypothetical protein
MLIERSKSHPRNTMRSILLSLILALRSLENSSGRRLRGSKEILPRKKDRRRKPSHNLLTL